MAGVFHPQGRRRERRAVYVEIPYFPTSEKLLYTRTDNPFAETTSAWVGSSSSSQYPSPAYEQQFSYSTTPSVIEIDADEYENALHNIEPGPSTTRHIAAPAARSSSDRYSVLSRHRSASTPTASTTYGNSGSSTPQYRTPAVQSGTRRVPRSATPFPLPERRQVLSHVEIDNLNQVLADPKWAAVREGYLTRQWLLQHEFERLRQCRKGKGKANIYLEMEDESEEEVDNALQRYSFSSTRGTDSSRPSSARSRSDSPYTYTAGPLGHREPRKGSRYSFSERFGDMALGTGMDDMNDDDMYVPSGGGEGMKRTCKGSKKQYRKRQESLDAEDDPLAGNWHTEPRVPTTDPSMDTDLTQDQRPILKIHLLLHPQSTARRWGPKSAMTARIKRPKKRKRRYDDVSNSEGEPVEEDVSSDSDWANEPGSVKLGQKDLPPSPSSTTKKKGNRYFQSVWTSRGPQRELRTFTEEEQARIEVEGVIKWCHMCHKKKLAMLCNGSVNDKCIAGFCDHCLSRYPLPFDPFATFSCPKCDGTCICGNCMKAQGKDQCAPTDRPKTQRRAAPRTKLSKAQREEQQRLLEAVKRPASDSETTDAGEDVRLHISMGQSSSTDSSPLSSLSSLSPSIFSIAQGLPDQETELLDTYWPITPTLLVASPFDWAERMEQETPFSPLPSPLHPSIPLDELELLSPALSTSATESYPLPERAIPYFRRQLQLVEAREKAEKQKRMENRAPYTSEVSSDLIIERLDLFRKEGPSELRLGKVKRKYGFLELDPGVAIPGQTWVGDIGMFAFGEEETTRPLWSMEYDDLLESSSSTLAPFRQQQPGNVLGVSLGQLEIRTTDTLVNDAIFEMLHGMESDLDSPILEPTSPSQLVLGSNDLAKETTPPCSVSTIVAEDIEDTAVCSMDHARSSPVDVVWNEASLKGVCLVHGGSTGGESGDYNVTELGYDVLV